MTKYVEDFLTEEQEAAIKKIQHEQSIRFNDPNSMHLDSSMTVKIGNSVVQEAIQIVVSIAAIEQKPMCADCMSSVLTNTAVACIISAIALSTGHKDKQKALYEKVQELIDSESISARAAETLKSNLFRIKEQEATHCTPKATQ